MTVLEFLEVCVLFIIILKGKINLPLEVRDVFLCVSHTERKGGDYMNLKIMNF